MANIIYAKFNSGSESRNVLDPNTWIGGVVPGPNDVARLWYAGINTSHEQTNLDTYFNYGQRDSNAKYGVPITTNALQGPLNNEITASKFIPSLLQMKSDGNYSSTAFSSLNTEANELSYKAYYQTGIPCRANYGPAYYKEYARYFRFNTNGVACSIIIDGVTYSEADTVTYDTRQKMCARFIELLEGNIPSKYRIIGPHNGTGITNNASYRETTYSGSYLTIAFESGSDVIPTNTHTVASQWYSSPTNITVGDNSNHYRTMKTIVTSSNPFLVMEGAAPSGSAGDYRFSVSYDWTSGSGYWWSPGSRQQLSSVRGIGPGNTNWTKVNFKNFSSTQYPMSCSIDTNYIVPTIKPYNDEPADEIYLDPSSLPDTYKSQSVSLFANYNNDIWTEYTIQKYELTGSQHWNVGMIEMGDYNHFHVKDNAKITLHDLQDGTYYPAIDFVNMGAYMSTLLVTDNVTIQVSSSRSSIPSETGIWCKMTNNSLIFSGSQNYSSSVAPSASNANDGTIQISNLSDNFGNGDYVTIESTGSYRYWNPMYKNHGLEGDLFLTGSTKVSMSYKDMITQQAFYGMGGGLKPQPYLVSSSIDLQSVQGMIDEWTHPIETDEIVQIVSMSADTATIAKRYPKEGKVHQDLGLYTYDNFAETFLETPKSYNGSKRVVIVDSTHNSFENDDVLVINDIPYNVSHTTTYLSQSKFFNFSDGSTRADQVFKSAQGQHSGSSIFTQAFGSYGITTDVYWAEKYQTHTLLITGSNEGYKGSGWGLEQGTGMQAEALGSYKYNTGNYGGRSGSSNGYTALRLDPTLAYTWRNDNHKIQTTNYLSGQYLIDNLLFEEGEITISGSLIRDGHGDPTSSIAWDPESGFGVLWESPINQSGAEYNSNTKDNPRSGYAYPNPYQKMVALWGYYGDPSIYYGGTTYTLSIPLGHSGSTGYRSAGNGTNDPYVTYKLFDTDFSSSLDLDIDHIKYAEHTGSCHIRVDVKSQLADVYLGIKDKEKLMYTVPGGKGKGGVSIWLKKYASIHSINIKNRYQMLILDTMDSFNAQDKIIEGGLLESHVPNKKVKFIGTEITDVKGFKNLAQDAIKNEGSSSIKPWIHSVCRSGTKATQGYGENKYYSNTPFTARLCDNSHVFVQGQANTNYYTIVDFGAPVEFDTVGMIYQYGTSYATEHYNNNTMKNVAFEVCDDIGIAAPSWTEVRSTEDDIRQYNGRPGIRYYTFASGSVTARYLKHKCSGGSRNSTIGYHLKHIGIYNISASCPPGTTPPSASIRDEYGGPTASICQIEFANTKNWSVGDELYFAHKTDTTFHGTTSYITTPTISDLTNYQSLTGSNAGQILGGLDAVYTIESINNNVITLDRPPIYMLYDGMIAYKFNRGGIRLEGMNNTSPFNFYTYTTMPWTHIQNVTLRNGYFNLQGDIDNSNYFFIDNVSVSSRSASPYQYMGIGPGTFMRNVLILGDWFGYGQTSNQHGAHSTAMYFNVVADCTRDMNNYQSSMLKKWVSNFEHNNHLHGGHQQQYLNSAGNHNNIPDKVILKNSFINMKYPNEYLRRTILQNQYGGNTYPFERPQISNIIFAPDPSDDFLSHLGYGSEQAKNLSRRYFDTHGKVLGVNLDTRHNSINGMWNKFANGIPGGYRSTIINYNINQNMDGTFVSGKDSKMFRGNDFVMLGHYYTRWFLVKNDNEFHLYGGGYPYKATSYNLTSLYCDFEVLEDTEVRFDFDCVYKLTFSGKYGTGQSDSSVDKTMKPAQQVILLNGNREVLDTIDFTAGEFETIQHRKVHSLPAGIYRIEARLQCQNQEISAHHQMSFKSMDLKLVTPDLSKVVVFENNFDVLTLFDKNRFKQRRDSGEFLTATSAAGKSLVLKQTTDLGGTTNYKFNKIKL